MIEAAAFIDRAWREGLAPEPTLTVSEWADQHRMLPSTSAEGGRWRTSRTPYLQEIMDAMSISSLVERVVVMKGAQLGGTEIGLNFLGYAIHNAPGLALLVMPSVDMVKRNTRTRIDPMIEASPELRSRIAPARSRDSGNTMSQKDFPGGHLVMTGANSAAALRSTPARYLVLDEVDAFPADVEGEGDPIDLAVKRTATFRGRRKILLISTPTIKGLSRIEEAYEESDQRRYYVPCPQCGHFDVIRWQRVSWPEGRRAEAFLRCDECGGIAEESDKPAMLEKGEWRATAPGPGKAAGFHLSALASPFVTWGEVAVEHGKVHKDPARLQVWVNTALGESWEDRSGEIAEGATLDKRREPLAGNLPEGAVVLTAGVDVQDDRLEAQVVAWGADEEAWIIQHSILRGDPSGSLVWSELERLLSGTWSHSLAVPALPIRAACIDTGGNHTAAAYAFTAPRMARRWWGIKGRGGVGVLPWPRKPSKGKGGSPVFVIGVDALKDKLAARLKIREAGPGYIHLADSLPTDFADQLTSERLVIRYQNGRPVRSWVPRSDRPRNEALDCFVYASAALQGLYAAGLRLNSEAEALAAMPKRGEPSPNEPKPTKRATIHSAWLER